ncbi:MAG: bifunctional acetaldehyde-CoA/alcohol dehydrogenase [Spirochaetales bacterium]|nr:bifunctional acetaldehyde-CoA/alcohol dehydrogenase [Spirochaetales bacterium]
MKEQEKRQDQPKEVEILIAKAKKAFDEYSKFSQEQVDKIFKAAALAANEQRIPLAKAAAAETGMGVVEDKVIKNHYASEYIYNKFKDLKTCGVIEEDAALGIIKVAEPIGIIAGVVPTTNPTSTAIFKALCALKTRNAIIISPHPRAKKCTYDAVKIICDAAVAAGAPENIALCIADPTIEATQILMEHKDTQIILATGGPGMVKAAYSSGKPALGVGAGNTPVVINETANIKEAVSSILLSKTFDNGMICASEQAVICPAEKYAEMKKEFTIQGAYILNKDERAKVGNIIFKDGRLNAGIVGQKAVTIAEMAGIKVGDQIKVLIGECDKYDSADPFAHEKLSPVLGLYKSSNYDEALDIADKLIHLGGLGHTSVLYTADGNTQSIEKFGLKMKTGRTLINMPASQGAIGDLFNFAIDPSLTLGCGSWGGNSVSRNVTPEHLINIKTVAKRRENMLWFKLPPKIYFKPGSLKFALDTYKGKKKAFIVTDNYLNESGLVKNVTEQLDKLGIAWKIYSEVQPDPTLETAYDGLAQLQNYKPDLIIAFGGGSPMDAGKIMWLLYEHPTVDFKDLAMRFMDIKKRIYQFPKLGVKAEFVAIPTTSGTGSEVTPFAVITDEKTGMKYPIADYELTPNMAIIDSELVLNMPARLTAYSGIDALTHALEAIVSVLATEFTTPHAKEAIKLLMEYLPRAYKNGAKDPEAREKVHHAAAMAGIAFANAFLGVCHSMAHKLGAYHHLPHGLANAMLINEVIRFNATDNPYKQGAFPQYKTPVAIKRYAEIADYLGLGGKTNEEKVEKLIEEIEDLKKKLDIPANLREAGVTKEAFEKSLDQMTEDAFDDQCTSANPRYPLISELKEIYQKIF